MLSGTPDRSSENAAGVYPATRADVPQNLQRLDRLANLGLLSASLAHEIKNGLVAVNTFCQIMQEKGENPELAELVQRELNRINGLVTQMLRLAAPRPANLAPVNLHELLELTLRLVEHQLRARLITVRREFHAEPPTVRADDSQLQQAIMNLMLNAMEAMGQGGELTLATETADGWLKLSICDTGAGIPRENLGQIFDTFFTTKKHGTGLGLAITRRVVDEHHGRIEVHSEVGLGSTFTISLPVK